jgi:uncharacterized membrane protein YcaP (DUF421 family)
MIEAFLELIGPNGRDPNTVQMCLRAVIILVVGLAIVRIAGKRMFGEWGAIDIVIMILIGSNLSRALTGNAPFVPTIVATTLLVALHQILTHAIVWFPPLGPWLKGQPRRLMQGGRWDARAVRRSGLGEHDLQEALRAQGLRCEDKAEEAWLERDGSISVIKKD